jgi:antitoxin component YwqK of YwqJK toxin-antitoxin module
MKYVLFLGFIISLISLPGCNDREAQPYTGSKLNKKWLNEIINESDSSYSKPYYRTDFVTAYYHINKKDSVLCQVMKDSSENIRQIIITKKKIRTFFAQYYPNGQALGITPVGKNGRFEGDAILFYENGTVESKGKYRDGFRFGVWKMYDEKGTLVKTEEYDTNGQLIRSAGY